MSREDGSHPYLKRGQRLKVTSRQDCRLRLGGVWPQASTPQSDASDGLASVPWSCTFKLTDPAAANTSVAKYLKSILEGFPWYAQGPRWLCAQRVLSSFVFVPDSSASSVSPAEPSHSLLGTPASVLT